VFLGLSGLATTVSWVAYFKALSIGSTTPVTAIHKASLAVTMMEHHIRQSSTYATR